MRILAFIETVHGMPAPVLHIKAYSPSDCVKVNRWMARQRLIGQRMCVLRYIDNPEVKKFRARKRKEAQHTK
jgi:hypothetical protein